MGNSMQNCDVHNGNTIVWYDMNNEYIKFEQTQILLKLFT